MINTALKLGSIEIPQQMIFWTKSNICAIIPCVQLVPGHVLIIPKRNVSYFNDLELQEVFDIGLLTRFLTKGLEKYYTATSSTVYIHNYNPNDSESLEQVYVHIIPRKPADFQNNDDIYKKLEEYDAEFTKKFKWGFTQANSSLNGVLEIEANECKKYSTFLETFQREEAEKS
ncbi:hypothetical protein ABPG74_010390 [Tetrahymena malaccensis]